MALIDCRECGAKVSTGAKSCPHCGVTEPDKAEYWAHNFLKTVLLVVVIFFVFSFVGSGNAERVFEKFRSKVKGSAGSCVVLEAKIVEDVFLIDSQNDYGFRLNAKVRNDGPTSRMDVRAYLSTSEGSYERAQAVRIEQNQTMNLSYGFHEPTINVSNVQGNISCE